MEWIHREKHPSCPSATTYRGDEDWLKRLRIVGLVVPLTFVLIVQAVNVLVIRPRWDSVGDWTVAAFTAAAAIAFGVTMFHVIQQGHRILLNQNRELGALNVVSRSIRGDLDVDELVESGMDQVMALTNATGADVVGHVPLSESLQVSASAWTRGSGEREPSRDLVIPLLAGNDSMGTMTLWFAPDAPAAGLSPETLMHIGQQLGSALLRALLIDGLRQRTEQVVALNALLLEVSRGEPLAGTLTRVGETARDVLRADAAGVRLPSDPEPEAASVTVEVRSDAGAAPDAHLWVARTRPLRSQEVAFVDTLAELAAVAVASDRLRRAEQHAATLVERERIGRELHDTLAQVLGVLHLRLRAAAAGPALADAERVRHELDELADLARESHRDVREAILGLRETSRTDRTLLEGLDAYLTTFGRHTGIDATLVREGAGEPALTPEGELQVTRIVQEALTNTRKHAGARRVTVRVVQTAGTARFEVTDDGRGFDPAAVAPEGHYGLRTMRERAGAVRGRVLVQTAPGAGVRVVVEVPTVAGAQEVVA